MLDRRGVLGLDQPLGDQLVVSSQVDAIPVSSNTRRR
jgi:hypothetical protein